MKAQTFSEYGKPIIKDYLGSLRLELDEKYLIDRLILEDGFWELHVTLYVQQMVKSGWTCIDVGANAGYIALQMAEKAGLSGKVLAFEPNPRVRDQLYRNISLNQGNIAPIETFTYGLGAEEGLYSLGEELGYGLGNASLSKAIDHSKKAGDIKVRTLDSFHFESVDFIKIDVEGMEYDVLRGSIETLMRCRPIVLFETLTRQAPEIHKKSEEFLKERGYLCYYLDVKKSALVQATYPHYPQEDTVAIPAEKIADIAC